MPPQPHKPSESEVIRTLLARLPEHLHAPGTGKEEKILWINTVLTEVQYQQLTREEKGAIRLFLQQESGYSRAQVERYISSYRSALVESDRKVVPAAEQIVPIAKRLVRNASAERLMRAWARRARGMRARDALASLRTGTHAMMTRKTARFAALLGLGIIVTLGIAGSTENLTASLQFLNGNRVDIIPANGRSFVGGHPWRAGTVTRTVASVLPGAVAPLFTRRDTVVISSGTLVHARAVTAMLDRREERRLVRLHPRIPAVTFRSSATQFMPRGILPKTLTSLTDLLGLGRNGQILMFEGGTIVWRNFPGLRVGGGANQTDTGGRRPIPEGQPREYGGGERNTTQSAAPHDHQNDTGGGVLDINQATKGILARDRGGTGFATYSTGDLLVGNANGNLSKLSVGAAGYVLTASGGTTKWMSPGSRSRRMDR
ncbi:hypothetical protein HYR82_01035 [Candidatus Peregrinibacteria bacterium]|nr:hypothetical protein [Candidatus Peregrinibacteria bacterium]